MNKEKAEKETRYVTVDSREEKDEVKPRKDLAIDWDRFIAYFNTELRKNGSAISPLIAISKGYKARLQAIVNEYETKMVVSTAVTKMAKSDFLNGRKKGARTGSYFLASFTWLFGSDEHFTRVFDGYYDNPPEQELTPEEQRQLELEKYQREQEQRRIEARRMEEEEREARRRQREYDAAHAARGAELQAIFDNLDRQFPPPPNLP